MTTKAGLWIDHRKAVLVFHDGNGLRIETIESEVEPHLRLAGGARGGTPYAAQDVASEGNRDRRIQGELHQWYQTVIEHLGHVAALDVIGPGEAKQEFAKEFFRKPAHRDIPMTMEPADRMRETEVSEYFRHLWHRPSSMLH